MGNFKAAKVLLCITAVLMVILGIATLFLPAEALLTMAILLGCGFFVTGIFYIITFFWVKNKIASPGWFLVSGILDLIIGVLLLANIKAAILAIPFIVAFWMLFGGISRIAGSVELNKLGMKNWWLILITGILGVIVSFLILFNPIAGAIATIIIVGIYLIIYGILLFIETITTRFPKI